MALRPGSLMSENSLKFCYEAYMRVLDREIGAGHPVYMIAEMSANHNHSYDHAVKIIEAAHRAGADAIKLQTYTPDTITLDCNSEIFRIKGTIWEGRTLHDLYKEAHMPWDWQPRLKRVADALGIHLFSSPFDSSAVDFLEQMQVPAYKIASPEIIDLPLIRKMASMGKPVIMSTGMATMEEIEEAVRSAREAGCQDLVLLKCTSAYPAPPEEANLLTMPDMQRRFAVEVGLSDHTLGQVVALTAVALGACVIEKHFTLARADGGPDSAFSMEPDEFAAMVRDVRVAEKALGCISYDLTPKQQASLQYRRSLFAVRDVAKGEVLTEENVRSLRPACGLAPRFYLEVLGRVAARDIPKGTPLSWALLA